METKEIENAVEAKIREHGIEFSAEFVPQSKSRNRDEENPTLNWRVTFTRYLETIGADGIAHHPEGLPRYDVGKGEGYWMTLAGARNTARGYSHAAWTWQKDGAA